MSGNETIIIPKYEDFCYMFHDRIHTRIVRYNILNKEDFTLFINVLDRNRLQPKNEETFVYAGTTKQRQLFEGYDKSKRVKSLDKNWDFLRLRRVESMSTVSTKQVFREFQSTDFGLIDINFVELTNYFSNKELSKTQIDEKAILDYHLKDFSKYQILSLPIIQFAEFEGVVHIVFKREFKEHLQGHIPYLIKAFSDEYENLLMDWDNVGINIEKESSLLGILERLTKPKYYTERNKNPILRELNYQEHYTSRYDYLVLRLNLNNEATEKMMHQHRRTAVMSILVDSFAHNISAHSLTALNWWFKQRAMKVENHPLPIFGQSVPIAHSIHPLLKFLLEKGAFWSGLNREKNFGGAINNLFDVLWGDFANNPLYLGSLAYSEGILKLNINITIIQSIDTTINNYNFRQRKIIKRRKNGILLNGTLVKIDLTQLYNENYYKTGNPFIQKGEKFNVFEEELKQYNIFFPAGVAGYHALFSMLENEIRNVKHYNQSVLVYMQENGLTLNISIEENYMEGTKNKNQWYKMGVWLKHPVPPNTELITERLEKLAADIITESYKPKLGGTYQDKVCAAMLFNNEFMSVQNRTNKRDKEYYPWIKSGFGELMEHEEIESYEDYEVSWRRYNKTDLEIPHNEFMAQEFEDLYVTSKKKGYFKKFFNLWKGEPIVKIDENTDFAFENISRFKFVGIPKENKKLFKKVRTNDIIRIVEDSVEDELAAYLIWLTKWFGGKSQRVNFLIGKTPTAQIVFDKESVRFYNDIEMQDRSILSSRLNRKHKRYKQTDFHLKHGERYADASSSVEHGHYCNFRSHGVFKSEFCNSKIVGESKIDPIKAAELIEILNTQICIFDNRIANRVTKSNRAFYEKSLGASIFGEETAVWNKLKDKGFNNVHFLVIHLSFIEAFETTPDIRPYNEKDISQFIENEIFNGNEALRKRAGENFMIVITTGRGRSEWWNNIENNDNYNDFVTFRPVEALIAAVEFAVSLKDDIELKYRLCKVLFGS